MAVVVVEVVAIEGGEMQGDEDILHNLQMKMNNGVKLQRILR